MPGGIPSEDALAAEIARIEAELASSSTAQNGHAARTPKAQNSGRNLVKKSIPAAPVTNPSVLDIEQEIKRMQQELEAASASASRTIGNKAPNTSAVQATTTSSISNNSSVGRQTPVRSDGRQSKTKQQPSQNNATKSDELDIEAEIKKLEKEMASKKSTPVATSTRTRPQQPNPSKTKPGSSTQQTSALDIEAEIRKMQLEIEQASASAAASIGKKPQSRASNQLPPHTKPSRRISDTAKRASTVMSGDHDIDALEASNRGESPSVTSFSSSATPLFSNRNQRSNYNDNKNLLPPMSISTVAPNIDLDAEIRAMEAEINAQKLQSQQQTQQKSSLTAEEQKRMKIDAEIKQMEAEIAAAAAVKPKQNIMGGINSEMIAAAAAKRNSKQVNNGEIVSMGKGKETTTAKKWDTPVTNESENDNVPAERPPHPLFGGGGGGAMMHNPLLEGIQKTALEREKRLEETGGQLIMQDLEPEVTGDSRGPQQLSFSMAEMVMQKAKARDKRLEDGGEMKMTELKPKDEIKKEFSTIAADAAALGRLTRLNEHSIEAVAVEKTPEEEWKSRGLLAIQWEKPSHLSIIQEAANLGAQTKKQEKVVSNFVPEEDDYYDEADAGWDEYYNSRMNTDPTTSHLNKLFELDAQAGTGQQKVDTLLLGLREENYPNAGDNDHKLVRPMDFYKHASLDDVQLPKSLPPRVDPKRNKEKYDKLMKGSDKPMSDIGNTVAELAWSRRTRLDRPGSLPIVRERCPCPYCLNPSPYQTYAYRVLETHLKETGEWEQMRQPLRMDDPRVRQMAKVAENQYGSPDSLPTHIGGANKENLGTNKKPNTIPAKEEKKEQKEVIPPKPVAPTPPPPPKPKRVEPVPTPAQAGCGCIIL